MNDNQIINENWFEAMTRQASESFDKLTIRKKVVKHIPIEIWEQVPPNLPISTFTHQQENYQRFKDNLVQIRNSGGRTYLVTAKE